MRLPKPGARLHVGCGDKRLEGWINVDREGLPGVDVVADVTRGLRFADATAIYAEHFLEHLALEQALAFLLESHRVLRMGAWLRLSTPNLDWVWATHYRLEASESDKLSMALGTNRAFRGWGHQLLWNRELLAEALGACGFSPMRWCRYGESELAQFVGVERHETYDDVAALPHVLIVEAQKSEPAADRLAALRRRIQQEFLAHLAD
jgi:hypothetical protein